VSALTSADLLPVPLFQNLETAQLDQLLDRHRQTTHQVDQLIVMEQDWGESVFLLRSGLAKVRTYTADGDEVVMSLLGEGDVFGEMAALDLDGATRSADVVALTPLRLVKLRAAPFAALLQQNATFAIALARLEASRLRDLNQRFALQSGDATTRLLDALAYLARKSSAKGEPTALIPSLPQREIALVAGLARETASRTLSKLRTRGTVIATESGALQLADLQPLVKRGLLPQT
jgi:CRP-like cAMP-binding protein